MASVTDAVHTQWGKAAEKQIDADGHESWKEEMYVDMIPWEYDRFRELLEKYSKIPPEEVTAEILKIRDKAWEVAKYPCIGHFTYVRLLEFGDHDLGMPRVIERLKAPGSQDTFLELGGFMFQTIRRLAFEGVDSMRLYGTDLHNEFIDLGYLQFRDRETLQATFVAGDMLAGDAEYDYSELARTFNEKISIVHASNFFHLFTWESQLVICERIMRFFRRELSPETPAVLFGNHYGSSKPGVVNIGAFRVFLHDEKTFQSLWDEIGRKTNTKWNVTMQPTGAGPPKPNAYGEDARNMHYVVSQEE
ncbi:hypothetical protein NPX13_g327 [Xylaria arbuscula]|uniref:Methyltransferase domain-containing protein n=1 Tax=Xylaria arbuscula TaxID=114810 RepID=A0A9W8TS45_9PEZI|nr:hypothetical protein NPX13_g327 [Xylaria arbuscula]